MDQLQTRLDALEQQMHTVNRRLRWWRGLACGLVGLAVLAWMLPAVIAQEDAADKGQKGLAQRVAALEKLLKHFSREGNEVTSRGPTCTSSTAWAAPTAGREDEPIPDCPNGLGNLIVGYNELRDECSSDPCMNIRTGSHNVVVGQRHNFSRFGGLVVGDFNTISGDFAVVSGGIATRPAANVAVGQRGGRQHGQRRRCRGQRRGGQHGQRRSAPWSAAGHSNTASGSGRRGQRRAEQHGQRLRVAVVSGGGNTASGTSPWSVAGSQMLPTRSQATRPAAVARRSVGGGGNTASGVIPWSAAGRTLPKRLSSAGRRARKRRGRGGQLPLPVGLAGSGKQLGGRRPGGRVRGSGTAGRQCSIRGGADASSNIGSFDTPRRLGRLAHTTRSNVRSAHHGKSMFPFGIMRRCALRTSRRLNV